MAKEPVCNRCGACCHFTDPQGIRRACRFLIYLRKDPPSTICRVYKTRLGRCVGIAEFGPIYCAPREAHQNEPGCPYNRA